MNTEQPKNLISTAEKESELDKRADSMIKRYAFSSIPSAFLPFPYVDIIILIGLQRILLYKLSKLYGIPFKKNLKKSMLATFMTGITPTGANVLGLRSALKMIPGVGVYIGGTSTAGLSCGSTYAVGKVFQQHFKKGGNFENFDPQENQDRFQSLFAEGKQLMNEKIKTK